MTPSTLNLYFSFSCECIVSSYLDVFWINKRNVTLLLRNIHIHTYKCHSPERLRGEWKYMLVNVGDSNKLCFMLHYMRRKEEECMQCAAIQLAPIPKLRGMCPLSACDWNLHSFSDCSTQSVVVYCHFESKSSAHRNTSAASEKEMRSKLFCWARESSVWFYNVWFFGQCKVCPPLSKHC